MASDLEQLASWILKLAAPNVVWEREHVFAKPRRYRFDFALVDSMVAVELEGGTFSAGRHTRGLGFRSDLRKYNLATALGWRVFRFDREMIENGEMIDTIKEAIKSENHTGAVKTTAKRTPRK